MKNSREIRARIHAIPAEEGGRQSPLFSGYRPAFYFGDAQTDGAMYLEEGEDAIEPGGSAAVTIKLLHLERLGDALHRGASFVMKEGRTVVARGTVLETFLGEEERGKREGGEHGNGTQASPHTKIGNPKSKIGNPK